MADDSGQHATEPAFVIFPLGTTEFAHTELKAFGQDMRGVGKYLQELADGDFDRLTAAEHMKSHGCLRYASERHDRWEVLVLGTDQPDSVAERERKKDTVMLLAPMARYLRREFPGAVVSTSTFTGTGPHRDGAVRPWLEAAVADRWAGRHHGDALAVGYVLTRSATPAINRALPDVARDTLPAAVPLYLLTAAQDMQPEVSPAPRTVVAADAMALAALVNRALDLQAGRLVTEVLEHHLPDDDPGRDLLDLTRALVTAREQGVIDASTKLRVEACLGLSLPEEPQEAAALLRAALRDRLDPEQ